MITMTPMIKRQVVTDGPDSCAGASVGSGAWVAGASVGGIGVGQVCLYVVPQWQSVRGNVLLVILPRRFRDMICDHVYGDTFPLSSKNLCL